MPGISIRPSRDVDGARVVAIWGAAVDATHHFLLPEDRAAIGEEVRLFLPQMPLLLAEADGIVAGFMGLSGSHMDALFVDPSWHGRGIGRALVAHAAAVHPALTTDVNEQNGQAIAFYERLGFVRTGRSPVDDQGRPYPLIHLRLRQG